MSDISPQKAAFFDWINNGSGSCVLEAVAGSGKTTALIEGLKLMRGSVFFGAYNKKIAEEIKARAPQRERLFIGTMHAAGFSTWRRSAPRVKVDENKVRDMYNAYVEGHSQGEQPALRDMQGAVLQLVSLAKQSAIGVLRPIGDDNAWFELIEHFDIDVLDRQELVIRLAQDFLQRSIDADSEIIDFDDMIYAPLIHKARVFENDWVLIDEAQDTNAARRALALRMLKRGGRLVAVGDRHQAIYGFTGADANALDLIRNAVSAKPLPLTVTYRCPKAVVVQAQKYVKHITAHASAPEGSVSTVSLEKSDLTELAKGGDVILCRFNAPLLDFVYQFIAKGIPAKVEGREIGVGLKQLARRWKVRSFTALRDRLQGYVERETAKYRAKEQESRAAAVEDKAACLNVIISRVEGQNLSGNPIQLLCDEIDRIFSDNANGGAVVLSSIHKSKGREWNRVFWLQTGPSKWARKAWEQEQEVNLCYVAATRAKAELFLVEMPKKEKAK